MIKCFFAVPRCFLLFRIPTNTLTNFCQMIYGLENKDKTCCVWSFFCVLPFISMHEATFVFNRLSCIKNKKVASKEDIWLFYAAKWICNFESDKKTFEEFHRLLELQLLRKFVKSSNFLGWLRCHAVYSEIGWIFKLFKCSREFTA